MLVLWVLLSTNSNGIVLDLYEMTNLKLNLNEREIFNWLKLDVTVTATELRPTLRVFNWVSRSADESEQVHGNIEEAFYVRLYNPIMSNCWHVSNIELRVHQSWDPAFLLREEQNLVDAITLRMCCIVCICRQGITLDRRPVEGSRCKGSRSCRGSAEFADCWWNDLITRCNNESYRRNQAARHSRLYWVEWYVSFSSMFPALYFASARVVQSQFALSIFHLSASWVIRFLSNGWLLLRLWYLSDHRTLL